MKHNLLIATETIHGRSSVIAACPSPATLLYLDNSISDNHTFISAAGELFDTRCAFNVVDSDFECNTVEAWHVDFDFNTTTGSVESACESKLCDVNELPEMQWHVFRHTEEKCKLIAECPTLDAAKRLCEYLSDFYTLFDDDAHFIVSALETPNSSVEVSSK